VGGATEEAHVKWEGWVQSRLRFLMSNIQTYTMGNLLLHPWPFEITDKATPHTSYFFLGLHRRPQAQSAGMKDFDLRGAVVEFKTKVHAWPGMTTDMTLKVKHMKQKDLPRFALPEAPAPRPAVKRKPTAAAGAEAAAAAKLSRTEEPTISGTHVSAVVVPAVSTEQGNHCNQLAGDAAADELDAENGHGGNGVMSYASALTRCMLSSSTPRLLCAARRLCRYALNCSAARVLRVPRLCTPPLPSRDGLAVTSPSHCTSLYCLFLMTSVPSDSAAAELGATSLSILLAAFLFLLSVFIAFDCPRLQRSLR